MIRFATKFSVPIKQCLSMFEDKCFRNAVATLKEFGINWNDIETCQRNSCCLNKKMDAVFFHQDRFEVLVDARGFRPQDIKCKITPNLIEIMGQRKENSPNGNKCMCLTRNYQLPQPVKPEEGNCCLSSEGVLLVNAPWRI